MKLSSAVTAAVSAALLVSAPACGDGSDEERDAFLARPAEQILADARQNMLALDAVQVDLRIEEEGATTDIEITVHGEDCAATMTNDGVAVDILRVDGRAWLQGDRDFWIATAGEDGGTFADRVGDSWVADEADSFGDLCDLEELVEQDSEATVVRTDEVTEIDGREAVGIGVDGSEFDGVVYVATAAPHYVLQRVADDGSFEVTFDDFNDGGTIDPPGEDEQFAPQ